MIQPTVGRVVHYFNVRPGFGADPRAAIVTFVHSDTVVNLCVLDSSGNTFGRTSVRLLQPGESQPNGEYCSWMPYQVQKAESGDNNSESAEPRPS